MARWLVALGSTDNGPATSPLPPNVWPVAVGNGRLLVASFAGIYAHEDGSFQRIVVGEFIGASDAGHLIYRQCDDQLRCSTIVASPDGSQTVLAVPEGVALQQWPQAAFSPDGTRVLLGALRGGRAPVFYIADLSTGVTDVALFDDVRFSGNEIVWSPNGEWLLTANDRLITAVHLETGERVEIRISGISRGARAHRRCRSQQRRLRVTAPLAAIDEWPVDNVAAGLVTTSGERHTRGPADKRFGLASVTKPLTTVVTLVAVEEDVVSLDDPAGPPGSTVRHLLAHASGLSPDNPDRSLAQVGARRIYSNAGFETLAAHVSQRAGIPFVDYWHEALMLSNTELRQSSAWGAESTVDDLLSLAEALLDPGLLRG